LNTVYRSENQGYCRPCIVGKPAMGIMCTDLRGWQREGCPLWMGAELSARLVERVLHSLDVCRVVCEAGRERYVYPGWVQSGF
jgi:hypothetical protein